MQFGVRAEHLQKTFAGLLTLHTEGRGSRAKDWRVYGRYRNDFQMWQNRWNQIIMDSHRMLEQQENQQNEERTAESVQQAYFSTSTCRSTENTLGGNSL